MTFRLLILALGVAVPGAAAASQNTPARDFAGEYAVAPTAAAFDLHLGLAAVTPDGTQTWGGRLSVALDVDGIDEAEADAIEDDLFASCSKPGLPDEVCDEAAAVITDAIVDLNDSALDLLPTALRMNVGSWGWVSNWFGLYPATVQHEAAAQTFTLGYLLNNNDGAAHGSLLSAGLALNGFASNSSNWICADVSLAAIVGGIDQPAGFELDADFIADRELACAANLGDGFGIETILNA